MRRERISYKGLARRLLAGRLMIREERLLAEAILTLGDSFEEAIRTGALLERIADRGALVRLPRIEERPGVHRYLDPGSNDRWAVELPGPGPAIPGNGRPEPAASVAPAPASDPPPAAPSKERPKLLRPIEEISPEPAVAKRFQDERTGEPLKTLFSAFSPCRTPEELTEALSPVRDRVLERTSATSVQFFLMEDPGRPAEAIAVRGETERPSATLGGLVADRVLGADRALHVPDLAAPAVDAPGDSGALCVFPLVSGEQRIGVVEFRRDQPGPFDPDELRLFALVALVSGGAIGRAEILEKLIYVDKLTGLYNRAYFDDQIEREIERANRSNTSVALMMADIDHFKRINDTFGHQAGDQALAHVASLFRANFRQIDIPARYGGEEFAILLPDTNADRAIQTAERLRRVVAASPIGELIPGLGETRLSISVGIALYPDDAGTPAKLIDRADRVALYAAKHGGRNRVVAYAAARETKQGLRPGA